MTDDEKEPQRPNANYKLSKPDNGPVKETDLHFYYNRESRLARAPKVVQDLYAERKPARFSLIRPLVSSKPMALTFFTVVILCVTLIVFSFTGRLTTSYSLDGTRLEVKGIRYEDMVIMVVRKTLKKGNTSAYTGAVDIAVSPAVKSGDENYPVFYHRIFFSASQEEEYRFAVPFDAEELVIVLQTEKSTLQLKKLKPE